LHRKSYAAHLAPDAVTLAELTGIWSRRPGMPTILSAPAQTAWNWNDVVAQMDDHFAKLSLRRTGIDIVVADAFVRYAVLPWEDALSGDHEIEMLARIRLEAQYGADTAAWDVVIDRREFGHGGLICAIAPGTLAMLRERCVARNLDIRSVVPDFMHRYNRLRRRVKAGQFLYVAACVGRCQIAYRNEAGWQNIRSVAMSGRTAEAFNDLLDRELLLQDCGDQVEVHLDLPGIWNMRPSDFDPRYRLGSSGLLQSLGHVS
jgi:hypothetical protein